MTEPLLELSPPAPRARRQRVVLGIAPNAGDRLSILTVQPEDMAVPPDGDRLAGWVADGWQLTGNPHGNLGRDALIEMRKGSSVTVAQAILGVERDGKHSKVVLRDVLTKGVKEPSEWKTLQDWFNDGWALTDITGNLEHGSWVILQKPLGAGDEG